MWRLAHISPDQICDSAQVNQAEGTYCDLCTALLWTKTAAMIPTMTETAEPIAALIRIIRCFLNGLRIVIRGIAL